MRKVGSFLTLCALFLLVSSTVSAGQYEGPQPGFSIMIDKFVGMPSETKGGEVTYSYVDNLGVNDFKFRAENLVFFKLKVKNTSNTVLEDVVVKDTAPSYVELFDNPGTFDSASRVLTINVGTLAVNEEKEYIVRGRITTVSNLPANLVTCVVNRATASNSKAFDEDSAQLCIEKPVLGESIPQVKRIPETGPEAGLIILPLSGLLAYAGRKLRKYS